MKRKAISRILPIVFLASMLSMAFNPEVRATGEANDSVGTVTIYPVEDSWVFRANTWENFGDSDTLRVSDREVMEEKWVYLGFDLASIPTNAMLVSAKIALYCYQVGHGLTDYNSRSIELYDTSSFDEMSITWDSKPILDTWLERVTSFSSEVWYVWESASLTADVDSHKGSYAWYAFTPNGTETASLYNFTDWRFYAKEYDGYDPYLEVTFTTRPPTEALEELIETLESWDLSRGTENSLKAKLKVAKHMLVLGKEDGAIRKLTAFISRVEMLRERTLADDQADYLISEAQEILDLIDG